MVRSRKALRIIALFLLLQFSLQTFLPSVTYALTSGPSQPEFSSFEPVGTTNMVDEFTGDFTYNLPLLEVPGPHGGSYPLSLSYHSGATPEEEASWVGFGWTLNAGAINRNVRGIPDDSKGDLITSYNKTPTNWTATLGAGIFLELFSADPGMFSPSIGASYRYNNYRGFGLVKNAGIVLGKGLVNIGYSSADGEESFSLSVNPMSILSLASKTGKKDGEKKVDKEFTAKNAFRSYMRARAKTTLNSISSIGLGSKYGIFTYNQGSVTPTYISPYTGGSINVSGAFDLDPSQFEIGVGINVMGSYSYQNNEPDATKMGYGYLYSSQATSEHLMDYHTEKDNPYDKQDEFIGMPFNDADQFIVTGEGIGGGFRLYTPTVGNFGPSKAKSSYNILQVTPEFELGLNFGGGVDIGVGHHTFEINDWQRSAANVNNSFPDFNDLTLDEPAFFRFNNDLGGSWGEKSRYDDKPMRFGMNSSELPSNVVDLAINNKTRGGRSSYIGFHTNIQLNDDLTKKVITYSKRDWSFFTDRSQNSDKIGELAVTNEDGMRYVYGLPVYGKDERNLNFGLERIDQTKIDQNYIAYEKRESETKVGQERKDPYAYSYLLTEILSPDYIDKPSFNSQAQTNLPNGPTPDDFGGYVRFGYNKIFGDQTANSKWFNWRIPYNGVSYQRNSLSDKRDDMGTLVSGKKEIYFLKSVETKTHVAIFYFSDRSDGMGALDDEAAMAKDQKSSDKLKKLDKIELYSLNAMGTITRDAFGNIAPPVLGSGIKPIKTVYFQYADSGNELMTGAPNNETTARGRLTLTKIYFEYNGVVKAKLSPYQFEYKYPTMSYPDPLSKSGYSAIDDFGLSIRAAGGPNAENPSYSPFNIDAWGNYQPDGINQYKNMRTWIDQSKNPNLDFDPAPWHLKRIILPSGGEIHVQYEQDDYQFVQDQDAHLMVPLLPTAIRDQPVNDKKFYIDLAKMGIATGDVAAKDALRKLILDRYANTKKKLYFKFLYTLKGSSGTDLRSCNAEYITGYAKVKPNGPSDYNGVGYDAIGFYIVLDDSNLPTKVCNDFVYANVIGRLNESTICSRSADMMTDGQSGDDKSKALSVVKAFFGATTSVLANGLFSGTYCGDINEDLSYLRLPTYNPKKGGGVRVKRLLMYDNSLEGAVLYGNSYNYTTTDKGRMISSGVASNEPSSSREENILIEYIPKKRQNWTNKIVAGKDKEVSEGPLGESVYPGPSVGYSKVTVTNIYSGNTNPGFSVSEFYTSRDFPVSAAKTDIHGKSKLKFRMNLFGLKMINFKTAIQGFSVVLNNMHGQVRRKAVYAGDYKNGIDLSKSTLVSEQVFDYFAPGEEIPVVSALYGSVTKKSLGREVDFTIAQRKISEENIDGTVELDLSAGIFAAFVLPFINFMGSMTRTESVLNTHATTKVVRYPAIVKKITTYQDGIYHTDEYVAFDELNGKPVAVKSEDEFKGGYLNQSIPAGWEYNNFTQKATNENKVIVAATAGIGITLQPPANGRYALVFTGVNACTSITQLAQGDFINLSATDGSVVNNFHVESINYGSDAAILVPSYLGPGVGSVSSPKSIVKLKVIESGRNNQLNQKAGSIVFHDPVKDNVDPSDLTDAARYITNSFTTALEAAYESANPNFSLPGTYTNMNMSSYSTYAPACNVDWANATVKNLYFNKVAAVNSTTLVMTRFDIQCTSGWITIQP